MKKFGLKKVENILRSSKFKIVEKMGSKITNSSTNITTNMTTPDWIIVQVNNAHYPDVFVGTKESHLAFHE